MRCLILVCLVVCGWSAVSDDGPFPVPSMRPQAWQWAALYGNGDGSAVVLAMADRTGERVNLGVGHPARTVSVSIDAAGVLSDGLQVLDHARRIATPDMPLVARWVRVARDTGFESISVTVPIPERRDDPLRAVFIGHQAAMLREAQEWMEPTTDSPRTVPAEEPLPPFSWRYTDDRLTEVTWWSADLVSTLDWRVYYSGGVHANTTLAGHTWRRDAAGAWQLLTLVDVLGAEATWRPAVLRAITDDLVRQQAGWYTSGDSGLQPADDALLKVWSVSGDGLVFNFAPYVVGPYSEGVFQVRVPWRQVGRERP
ncbi:MAG: DUF3298 domain-containing protein [Planctomycetes bacterium]|nr:DUF3298 domain-containing protein [Planctomycetota bacterium]